MSGEVRLAVGDWRLEAGQHSLPARDRGYKQLKSASTPLINARNPRAGMRKIHLTSEEEACATFHAMPSQQQQQQQNINCNFNITSHRITDITQYHTVSQISHRITANFSVSRAPLPPPPPTLSPGRRSCRHCGGPGAGGSGELAAVNRLVLLHITPDIGYTLGSV